MEAKLDHQSERQPGRRKSSGVLWSLISGLVIHQILWGNTATFWMTVVAIVAAGVVGLVYLKK